MVAIVKLDKIRINEAGEDGSDKNAEWKLNFRVDGQNPSKTWSDGSVRDGDWDYTPDNVNGGDHYWVVNASPGQGISLEAWGKEDDFIFDDNLPRVSRDYHGGDYNDYQTTASNGGFSYTLFWDINFV